MKMKMCTSAFFLQVYLLCQYGAFSEMPKRQGCGYIEDHDVKSCGEYTASVPKNISDFKTEPCKGGSVCRKNFIVTVIDYPPISKGMQSRIMNMLRSCCGHCATVKRAKIGSIFQTNSTSMNTSDMLLPVVSKSSVEKLYGFYFIPFIDVPPGFYVELKKTKEETLNEVVVNILGMWPLLVILLILAMLAGFAAWILDTWSNSEDFSRPFLVGLFDGFWWAYVSMTTVGYGDKVTKSLVGRIFSVFWILIGITIFSMLTASLSNVITEATTVPSTDLLGKTVGVLEHRSYDANLAARHGANLRSIEYEDLFNGISKLVHKLSSEALDGFLVDKYTYMRYSAQKGDTRLKKTVYTELEMKKEKLSFGILVKHKKDYEYFQTYAIDNWMFLDTCRNMEINREISKKQKDKDTGIFSISSGLFYPVLMHTCIALVIVLAFGALYEVLRYKKKIATTVAPDTCGQ